LAGVQAGLQLTNLGDEGITRVHGVVELTGELCDLLDRQDFGGHRAR